MVKRILAVLLASLMLCGIFASCGEKEPADVSSKITASEEASSKEEISSVAASSEKTETSSVVSKEEEEEEETSTSSKKGFNRGDTNSESTSSSVKVYKNAGTAMLGCFHFNTGFTTAYGSDNESKLREFEQIVKEGYFNTYFISTGTTFMDCVKIIAENGGTFWVSGGKFESGGGTTIEQHLENLEFYFDMLKEKGYWDLFNGFYWDEPIWHGQKNEDFLLQTKAYYTKWGKRNFPVFACGEFSGEEGNTENLGGITADQMRKLDPKCAIYVTDAAYDSYSVDVREGATNGGANQFAKWQKVSPKIVDGKSYYTEYKEYLKKYIGHQVNYWYYPTAYVCYLWGGINGERYASEDYCVAHLEFMADDILKEEYPGGLIIYTYATFGKTDYGFARHADVKDSKGNYTLYPDENPDKWEKYCDALRNTTKKFNSVTTKKVTLNV